MTRWTGSTGYTEGALTQAYSYDANGNRMSYPCLQS